MGECATISFIDDLVFKSVDETLAAVLGFTVRDAVYLALLTDFSVTKEELPKHLDKFEQLLEHNFGERAAEVLSRSIARRLCSELKLSFVEHAGFGLPEYVAEAKSKLLKIGSSTTENLDTKITGHRKRLGNDDSN